MWLLDKNVPIQLKHLLSEFGIESVTADSEGWGQLTNGKLVAAAASHGISCILTRDHLFSESALHTLKGHAEICVVLLILPQLRAPAFLKSFREAWLSECIRAVPGQTISWPRSVL